MCRHLFILLIAGWSAVAGHSAMAADRPNFVWILSEDNSKHYLRLFDSGGAPAPNIERLAENGLVFTRAFSCAPVCSVARTTLMSGVYAPRAGFQYHRKEALARLPGGLELWPAYLRGAGYFTSNHAKKDYNVEEGAVWDESSREATWRNRPDPATPFFHMQTFTQSHESSLHFDVETMKAEDTETPPSEVELAPYHPNTPVFRYTYARYLDRMRIIDSAVGELVSQLEADGLLEDTFIFYFGDHGGVLPRSKGYLYESGLHVPLVVRIPKNWAHLVSVEPGNRVSGFVQFIDFGPTVLHLAGVDVPAEMDGRPFLGPDISPAEINRRDRAFGYADRFDEKYDFVRSIRVGPFKYLRNYQAYYPDGLQNNYRYRMLAYQEWRRLFRAGRLNATQSRFFQRRPPEQLFDLRTDPYEVENLAGDPEFADTLESLRAAMQTWVRQNHDLSFYPEPYLVDHALPEAASFGKEHAAEIDRLAAVADLTLRPFDRAEPALRQAVTSDNPWERYWGLIDCSVFSKAAESLVPLARECLGDTNRLVRIRAAEFLGSIHRLDPRPVLFETLNAATSPTELLLEFNTVVYLRDMPDGYPFDTGRLDLQISEGVFQRRLDYLNAK